MIEEEKIWIVAKLERPLKWSRKKSRGQIRVVSVAMY